MNNAGKIKYRKQNIFVEPGIDSIPHAHRFSHEAMATIFEIFILHEDCTYAQQAAWEAFSELDKLELELSRFIENSDISRINKLAAGQSTQIGLDTFDCLQICTRIFEQTGGAFDITVGALLDCWQNEDKSPREPSETELERARQYTGMRNLKLNECEHTVQVQAHPVQIDLGGFGKGYGLDKMAEILRDWEMDTALIHGGYSTVLALGVPQSLKGWPVTISHTGNHQHTLAHFYLHNQALSGSGLQKGPHIIDPRQARPVQGSIAAWTLAPTAATADALSTTFMIMHPEEIKKFCKAHRDVLAVVVSGAAGEDKSQDKIDCFGDWEKNVLVSFMAHKT